VQDPTLDVDKAERSEESEDRQDPQFNQDPTLARLPVEHGEHDHGEVEKRAQERDGYTGKGRVGAGGDHIATLEERAGQGAAGVTLDGKEGGIGKADRAQGEQGHTRPEREIIAGCWRHW
jgi:hypothetical protein